MEDMVDTGDTGEVDTATCAGDKTEVALGEHRMVDRVVDMKKNTNRTVAHVDASIVRIARRVVDDASFLIVDVVEAARHPLDAAPLLLAVAPLLLAVALPFLASR